MTSRRALAPQVNKIDIIAMIAGAGHFIDGSFIIALKLSTDLSMCLIKMMSILHKSCRLDPTAQNFRYAPCLSDAASGHVRLSGIENFADRADAVVAEVDREHFEKFSRTLFVVRMNL